MNRLESLEAHIDRCRMTMALNRINELGFTIAVDLRDLEALIANRSPRLGNPVYEASVTWLGSKAPSDNAAWLDTDEQRAKDVDTLF